MADPDIQIAIDLNLIGPEVYRCYDTADRLFEAGATELAIQYMKKGTALTRSVLTKAPVI